MKQIQLPEEYLNELAKLLSEKSLQDSGFSDDHIEGTQLQDFSAYEQINRFLLFQVYQVWSIQMSKFRHPYFDFEHEEVKESLKILRNLLSRHISIDAEDFRPLLSKAFYNNIRLLLNPEAAFESFFFHNRSKISLEEYEKYAPFFSDFDFIINSILRYHQKNEMEYVEKDVFFLKMNQIAAIYNKRKANGIHDYRDERLRELANLELDELAKVAEEEAARREEEHLLELQRLEEEKRKADEAKRREEEARKKQEEAERRKREVSFFDSLKSKSNVIEIEDEEDELADLMEQEEKSKSKPESETPKEEKKEKSLLERMREMASKSEARVKKEAKEKEAKARKMLEDAAEEERSLDMPSKEQPESAEDKPSRLIDRIGKKEKRSILDIAHEKAQKKEKKKSILEEAMEKEKKESLGDRVSKDKEKQDEVEDEIELVEERLEDISEMLDDVLDDDDADEQLEDDSPEEPETKDESPAEEKQVEKEEKEDDDRPNILESSQSKHHASSQLDKLKEGKKSDLNKISLVKRMEYVKQVFQGNHTRFNVIISKAQSASNLQEVEDLLDKFVFQNEEVEQDNPSVMEFVELLRDTF